MTQTEAIHCKATIDALEVTHASVKVLQMFPTDERDDMWVVVIGIPPDCAYYNFDDDQEVNIGILLERKCD